MQIAPVDNCRKREIRAGQIELQFQLNSIGAVNSINWQKKIQQSQQQQQKENRRESCRNETLFPEANWFTTLTN